MMETLKNQPRSEFNKTLKSINRFIRPGAETPIVSDTGNKVTAWERREVGIKVATINRARTRERKVVENMDATSRGESLGLKRGEMGSERLNELKPKQFNFDKIRGGKEWEKYKAMVDKLSSPEAKAQRMERYKENYIKGLRESFGGHADELIEMIEGLPAEEVVRTYYSEQEATIEFFYEPQSMELKLDALGGIWKGVTENYEQTAGS